MINIQDTVKPLLRNKKACNALAIDDIAMPSNFIGTVEGFFKTTEILDMDCYTNVSKMKCNIGLFRKEIVSNADSSLSNQMDTLRAIDKHESEIARRMGLTGMADERDLDILRGSVGFRNIDSVNESKLRNIIRGIGKERTRIAYALVLVFIADKLGEYDENGIAMSIRLVILKTPKQGANKVETAFNIVAVGEEEINMVLNLGILGVINMYHKEMSNVVQTRTRRDLGLEKKEFKDGRLPIYVSRI